MRPPRALSLLALTVLLFQTAGCGSWVPVQSELPTRPVPAGVDRTVKIRVETTNGARHELERGWMSSDSVGGVFILRNLLSSHSFPLTQVRTVEKAKFSPYRTFFLLVGVGALTFAVGAAMYTYNPQYTR